MGGIISGIGSIIGSGQASRKAEAASSNLNERYNQISGYTQPFIQAGQNVLQPLQTLATSGSTAGGADYVARADAMMPGQMTQAELEATPGYKFALDEGTKAATGSAAARGLGVSSGGDIRGITRYATGLANQTYKDQFDIAQKRFSDVLSLNTAQQGNISNQYNRLFGVANMGAGAASNLGTVGTNLGNYQANMLNNAGINQALGTQALSTGIADTVNQLLGTPTTGGTTTTNAQGGTTYSPGSSLNMQMANWLGRSIGGV